MIDFYRWPTPNGWKIAIVLESPPTVCRDHRSAIRRADFG